MPKVSIEHKQRRREEILEGAQRAFARHGYEGATVTRLEEETGLSRGAIFSYFENKEALFIGVVGRSSERLVEIWLERGFRALLEAIVHEDPEWLSVQIEATRRVRTEERFREQLERLDKEAKRKRPSRFERLQPVGARGHPDRGDGAVPQLRRQRPRHRAHDRRRAAGSRPADPARRVRRRASLAARSVARRSGGRAE